MRYVRCILPVGLDKWTLKKIDKIGIGELSWRRYPGVTKSEQVNVDEKQRAWTIQTSGWQTVPAWMALYGSIVSSGINPTSLKLGKRTYFPFQTDTFCAQQPSSWILVAKNPCRKTLMDKIGLKVIKPCAINSHPPWFVCTLKQAHTEIWTPSTSLQQRVYNWNV